MLLSPRGLLKQHPEEYWGILSLFDFDGAHLGLFALTGIAAVFALLHVAPRSASAVLFLGVSSIQARNPWSLDGGDWCLRWLLLWNLLVSLEAAGMRSPHDPEGASAASRTGANDFSFAGAGLLLQPVVLYLSSVLHKIQGNTWREGTALEAALSQSLWQRPLGAWIAQTEHLPPLLNYLTLAIEALGPLLLLSPFRAQGCRLLGLALLTLLQLGIGLCLRMNLFPWIMTLSLLPFVPGSAWPRYLALRVPRGAAQPSRLPARFSQALLLQSLIACADSVLGGRLIPGSVARVQTALGLDQSWSMYSPNPYRCDFGIEVSAKTSAGETLLIDPGRRDHPFPPLSEVWADYRGGMYLENVSSPSSREELSDLAEWIAREHAALHGTRLVVVSLFVLEWKKADPDQVSRTSLLVWNDSPARK